MERLKVRLALSAVGGVAIPFLYGYASLSIAAFFRSEFLARILGVPVLWPTWIYNYFYPASDDAAYPSNGWFISLYLGNFLLYSLLTYIILSWRGTSKRLP